MTQSFGPMSAQPRKVKPLIPAIVSTVGAIIAIIGMFLPLVQALGESAGSTWDITFSSGRSLFGTIFGVTILLALIMPWAAYFMSNKTKAELEESKGKEESGPITFLIASIIGLIAAVLFLFVIDIEIEGTGQSLSVQEYANEIKRFTDDGGLGLGFWLLLLGFIVILVGAVLLYLWWRNHKKYLDATHVASPQQSHYGQPGIQGQYRQPEQPGQYGQPTQYNSGQDGPHPTHYGNEGVAGNNGQTGYQDPRQQGSGNPDYDNPFKGR